MASETRASVKGIGHHVPDKVLDNAYFESIVETSNDWIIERTGIRERRQTRPEEASSDLAAPAAQKALADAGMAAEDVDLIICATVTPDFLFPSTACVIQDRIGAKNAAAFDLSAGCSGFLYSCNVGAQLIENGRYRNVLAIGVETLTKIVDFSDRNTCVLFGDGAGAAVLGPAAGPGGILATHMKADGSLGYLLQMPGGGSRHPATHETIDQHMHYIKMEGREVFKHAVRAMCESATYVLEKAGYRGSDVDVLVPHQANLRIMSAVADRLGIPESKVFVNLFNYGNTSACSIPLALSEARQEGKIQPGHLVLCVAFGAGFTWAATLMRWE